MIDGVEESDPYPQEFFIDLVFGPNKQETTKQEAEDAQAKNSFWQTFGNTCAEKRKKKVEIKKEDKKTEIKTEVKVESQTPVQENNSAFVIDEGKEVKKLNQEETKANLSPVKETVKVDTPVKAPVEQAKAEDETDVEKMLERISEQYLK